jgi:hypothetical protein
VSKRDEYSKLIATWYLDVLEHRHSTKVRTEAHLCLVNLFVMFRQVQAQLGRARSINDDAELFSRIQFIELDRLYWTLQGDALPTYALDLCHIWAGMLSWYWDARDGPAIVLVMLPTTEISIRQIWKHSGKATEDIFVRETRRIAFKRAKCNDYLWLPQQEYYRHLQQKSRDALLFRQAPPPHNPFEGLGTCELAPGPASDCITPPSRHTQDLLCVGHTISRRSGTHQLRMDSAPAIHPSRALRGNLINNHHEGQPHMYYYQALVGTALLEWWGGDDKQARVKLARWIRLDTEPTPTPAA